MNLSIFSNSFSSILASPRIARSTFQNSFISTTTRSGMLWARWLISLNLKIPYYFDFSVFSNFFSFTVPPIFGHGYNIFFTDIPMHHCYNYLCLSKQSICTVFLQQPKIRRYSVSSDSLHHQHLLSLYDLSYFNCIFMNCLLALVPQG